MLLLSFFLAVAPIDVERLVDAIGRAENSRKHPYGVMQKYRHTTPRQACRNSVVHRLRDWQRQGSKGDFVAYLGSYYAPTKGATNDPKGLNKNWISNVNHFYRRSA